MLTTVRTHLFFCWLLPAAIWLGAAAGAGRIDAAGRDAPRGLVQRILQSGGIRGGVILHLGCGDGRLTAAFCDNDRSVIQGLDTDANRIREARERFEAQGSYGRLSANRFDGEHLPYAENMVNLLVVSRAFSVDRHKMLRVLCPSGAAVLLDPSSTGGQRRRSWSAR